MTTQNISMKDLHAKLSTLGKGDLILDVRTPEEYLNGHIEGSRNIPHDQVTNHIEELKKYKTVYLHCQAGKRAERATQALTSAGLTNIVGITNSGMGDWIKAGFPIVK